MGGQRGVHTVALMHLRLGLNSGVVSACDDRYQKTREPVSGE